MKYELVQHLIIVQMPVLKPFSAVYVELNCLPGLNGICSFIGKTVHHFLSQRFRTNYQQHIV